MLSRQNAYICKGCRLRGHFLAPKKWIFSATAVLESQRPSQSQLHTQPGFQTSVTSSSTELLEKHAHQEAERRKRKTEWKRRQSGSTFQDHHVVTVQAGKGGDGCVAFHRDKHISFGPPSGGNGGQGGDVYIIPTPHLTTLSSIQSTVKASPGANGQGTWMNGANAPPTIIRVPLGTTIRQLPSSDPRCSSNELAKQEEELNQLSPEERKEKERSMRWVHYPGAKEGNEGRDAFLEAEKVLRRVEMEARVHRAQQIQKPIFLDLDSVPSPSSSPVPPSSTTTFSIPPLTPHGYLLVSGGAGGIGNPAFHTLINRSPKFATRGKPGQRLTFELELKLLSDIGLVGFPNAGKSTLLRALTKGRARTRVAGYEFTTLNPVVAVVRVTGEDGEVLGGEAVDGMEDEYEYGETDIEEQALQHKMERGELAHALTRNQLLPNSDTEPFHPPESFRFSISDNPGLLPGASHNVGLGHSFLRSIERSLALAYVVDLTSPHPEQELMALKAELEAYKTGLSAKARIVIANKADLLVPQHDGEGGDESKINEAKAKLKRLEEWVEKEMKTVVLVGDETDQEPDPKRPIVIQVSKPPDVVPVSAKYGQNIKRIVKKLCEYVREERGRKEGHSNLRPGS